MDISAKMLREVEFRDRLRGYDTDEVDEFLEKVAIGIDEFQAELAQARERAAALERQPAPPPEIEDDTIRRTLVLAQRTADLAIKEANEEAAQLVADAREEAERVLDEARAAAYKVRSEAEQGMRERVERLSAEHDHLEREVRSLTDLLDAERARLGDALSSLMGHVTSSLSVSNDVRSAAEHAVGRATEEPPPAPFLVEEPVEEVEDLDLDLGLGLEPLAEEEPPAAPSPVAVPDQRYAFPRSVEPDRPKEVSGAVNTERASSDPDEELWERWAKSSEGTHELGPDADPFHLGRRGNDTRP